MPSCGFIFTVPDFRFKGKRLISVAFPEAAAARRDMQRRALFVHNKSNIVVYRRKLCFCVYSVRPAASSQVRNAVSIGTGYGRETQHAGIFKRLRVVNRFAVSRIGSFYGVNKIRSKRYGTKIYVLPERMGMHHSASVTVYFPELFFSGPSYHFRMFQEPGFVKAVD